MTDRQWHVSHSWGVGLFALAHVLRFLTELQVACSRRGLKAVHPT